MYSSFFLVRSLISKAMDIVFFSFRPILATPENVEVLK